MKRDDRGRSIRWLLLGLAAACLLACGGDEEAAASAHARGALGRDGFSELSLVEVRGAPGTFDFTGQKEGQRCEGTVVVRGGGGSRTAAISSQCEPMDDAP